jgi:ABC-2 type transport system ATP-binding protein
LGIVVSLALADVVEGVPRVWRNACSLCSPMTTPPASQPQPAIETHGLGKRYGRDGTPALSDLDLHVRRGEIFGFLGPNGAGKSTTIRLLLGFLHATTGRATVLGHDIERDSVAIRRRVGYLPGGIAFWDDLSGQQLLDELGGLSGRPSVLRPMLLDRLELSAATLRRPVRAYSRGMRQKLGIIQALQHDPELAILDEPSEGLDPLMQRAFYAILDERKAAGRTIFFSSHVLSEVERVCDRVAIVRHGRLVAVEDVASLLTHRKRQVEVRLRGPLPNLATVAGVSDLAVDGDRLSFRLEGEVGPFLAALAAADVVDLTIEAASLEDAFLEYYTDDGDGPAGAADPSVRAGAVP